jgi:hypothetical protein
VCLCIPNPRRRGPKGKSRRPLQRRAHDSKVVVDRDQLGNVEALGQRHRAGIGGVERQFGVALDEISGSNEVAGLKLDERQERLVERAQGRLGASAAGAGQQVAVVSASRSLGDRLGRWVRRRGVCRYARPPRLSAPAAVR